MRRTLVLAAAAVALVVAIAVGRRLASEPPSDEQLVAKLLDDAARAA